MEMMGMDSTHGLSAADTAKAYLASIQTKESGTTLDAREYA
jgi:hypothetical protein